MSVEATDLKIYLTTGATGGSPTIGYKTIAQNDPDASLGGFASTTEVSQPVGSPPSSVNLNLYDIFTLSETAGPFTAYRCIAMANEDAGSPFADLTEARIFFDLTEFAGTTGSPLASDWQVGVSLNAQATPTAVIADEESAPGGISFQTMEGVDSYANGIKIGGGSPPADGDLTSSNVLYIWFSLTFNNLTEQLLGDQPFGSPGVINGKLSMSVAGGTV